MGSTPSWAEILESLYWEGEFTHGDIVVELAQDDDLVRKSELDDGKMKRSLGFLIAQDLLEPKLEDEDSEFSDGSEPILSELRLTEDGFEVVHEFEMSRTQDQLSRMMLLLTLGLFATAIVEALGAVYAVKGIERTMMVLGMTLIVGVTLVLVWRAGWFD